MRFNFPHSRHSRQSCQGLWQRLPSRLLRGFALGLTLGLVLTSAGLMR